MDRKELLATIHRSIIRSNEDHMQWTGGWRITDYGVEQFVVGDMARAIMNHASRPSWATLETSFKEICDANGARPKGRPHKAGSAGNRADLVLYSGERICNVIEVKRSWSSSSCFSDLDRLSKLTQTFAENGAWRCGIFVLVETADGKDGETALEKLRANMKKHADACADHLDQKGVSRYEFSHGMDHVDPHVREDDGGADALSSLCVAIF